MCFDRVFFVILCVFLSVCPYVSRPGESALKSESEIKHGSLFLSHSPDYTTRQLFRQEMISRWIGQPKVGGVRISHSSLQFVLCCVVLVGIFLLITY